MEIVSRVTTMFLRKEVFEMLYPAQAVENINIKELPGELQQKINKALNDFKSGNYITHEEMKQKLQPLFRED